MIKITQGDTASIQLTATDGNNRPIDLTGASFSTSVLGDNGVAISFPNAQHTANPDQVLFKGQFTLALSSIDTMGIPVGINKEIITLIVIGLTQVNYRGPSALNVYSPIPVS